MKRNPVTLILLAITIIAPLNRVFAYGTDYRYESKLFDVDTQLYDFNARQYNPNIGQFIQSDTYLDELLLKGSDSNDAELQQLLAEPQRLNQRSFKNNNPINYTDPSGKSAVILIPLITLALSDLLLHDIKVAQSPTLNSTPQVVGDKDVADFIPGLKDMSEEARLATGVVIGSTNSRLKSGLKLAEKLVGKTVGKVIGKIFQRKAEKAIGSFVETRFGKVELTKHALERLEFWKVDLSQVQEVMNKGETFKYFHEGVLKTGFYDESKQLFVGMTDKITTVINRADRKYINNLLNN